LNLFMTTLGHWRVRNVVQKDGRNMRLPPDTSYRMYPGKLYDWESDFPLKLQNKKTKRNCEITVEFKLDDVEVDEFHEKIGSAINGALPIKICYMKDEFKISVAKPGTGGATLNKKTTRVAEFISRKIRFDYIPAIRTADTAEEIVKDLLYNELSLIEEDDRYKQALQTIEDLQAPVLRELSESITSTVSSFLPSVKEVEVVKSRSARSRYLRHSIKVNVDDGVKTDMTQKGDGVLSLLALALMRHASSASQRRKFSLVAIEEPESHLHPKAIRDLRDVIFNLTDKSQVAVSSHSPLLVRWEGRTSSVIVGSNKAIPAKKISEVRDCLGVLVSDNLTSVEFIVFCEGRSDGRILEMAIQEFGSESLRSRLTSRRMGIRELRGISKLRYQLSEADQNVLGFHVYADNDAAAKTAIESALKEKLLKHDEYTLCSCIGMKESEIEDMFLYDVYEDMISSKYGVDISKNKSASKGKWSERIKHSFETAGKIYTDEIREDVKKIVCDGVEARGIRQSLIEQKAVSLHELLENLERRLQAG